MLSASARFGDLRIVPNVATSIVSKEDSIKQRKILKERVNDEPVNDNCSERYDRKANGNPDNCLVGVVSVQQRQHWNHQTGL